MAIAVLFTLATFGQTDVYHSAYWDNYNYQIVSDWIGIQSNDKPRTFEMWIKLDTLNDMNLIYTPGGVFGAQILNSIDIHKSDTTLHFSLANNDIHAHFTFDTNWHHIAFVNDTLTGYDSLSAYIDGQYICGDKFTHILMYAGPYGTGLQPNTNLLNSYQGYICKFSVIDSALYHINFTPDCVFDSINYWTGGTIGAPYQLFIPLSNDGNIYLRNTVAATDSVSSIPFTLSRKLTSPCNPIYNFIAPPSCNDSETIYCHQTNKSWLKGAHYENHRNGWDTTIITPLSYGEYTDSMEVYTTAIYPYYNDEYYVMDTLITVHFAEVNKVYNINGIKLYPNPSKGDINIVSNEPIKITIYDMTGKLIYNKDNVAKELIHLSTGMYLIGNAKIIIE